MLSSDCDSGFINSTIQSKLQLVDFFCQLIHILIVFLYLLNHILWGPVVFKLGAQRYTSSSTTRRIILNYEITNPLIGFFLGLISTI